ncbi:PQQ-dependent catabolism-associated CXXCW motif protein [Celeribacter neptunius]|uniref:PQQ-dependent catabolism-associated CXXCW motif protein n=1 Tax=Celeribacter neptunius TaxID=588602 RepID=A0A1I3W061_9RHOB|nr:PQQ-dependent catabolism-associated CXXCW motif protein [Celeribacter neptunius]SFK00832.1 PQQ-dependent catabolism-associated CXXCW motif protein [Celeribacter neptunius]
MRAARSLAVVLKALIVLLLLPLCAGAQEAEPEGYRMEHYRGPVPESLSGATVIGPEAAYELWTAGGVGFIDVLPQAPKPANLPEGTIWRDKPRLSIPGAIWLPNVGYGALAPQTDGYFRAGLSAATGGDTAHPVLFFCLEECWMSWNAAKRALEYGYSHVYWLPEGTDGWAFYDYPLEQVVPREPQPR